MHTETVLQPSVLTRDLTEERLLQKVNLHTHTVRCGHARGEEREYIEAALRAGIRVLGFSDHVPMPFPNGYRSGIRMAVEETENYVRTLLALREEYRERISIYIGYEAEYYPRCFGEMLRNLLAYPCDFLILGQHFTENEFDGAYAGRNGDEKGLVRYVEQILEGLQTGVFSYVAHPDLYAFQGEESFYRAQMERLCRGAKERNIPLEINLLGLAEGRHYPKELFWEVAAQVGNEVVLGSDAHSPGGVYRPAALDSALKMAERLGLEVLQTPEILAPRAV